jgi:hypothetical protein
MSCEIPEVALMAGQLRKLCDRYYDNKNLMNSIVLNKKNDNSEITKTIEQYKPYIWDTVSYHGLYLIFYFDSKRNTKRRFILLVYCGAVPNNYIRVHKRLPENEPAHIRFARSYLCFNHFPDESFSFFPTEPAYQAFLKVHCPETWLIGTKRPRVSPQYVDFQERFRKEMKDSRARNQTIQEFLQNQSYFTGLKDYLVVESLYAAGINKDKQIFTFNTNEVKKLYQQIKKILIESYQLDGTLKDIHGEDGEFASRCQVWVSTNSAAAATPTTGGSGSRASSINRENSASEKDS